MTPPILSSEPLVLPAGETIKWRRVIADFPQSDGWVPKYYFAGVDVFNISGTLDGNGWLFTVGMGDIAAKPAGTYRWTLYVEKPIPNPTERYRVDNGVLDVTPNIVSAAAGALQTHEEKAYAALKALVEGRLTADLESYQIEGRAVSKIPIKEAHHLLVIYAWKVWRQKNPGQIGVKVSTAFFPPDGTIGAPEPVMLPPFYRYGG